MSATPTLADALTALEAAATAAGVDPATARLEGERLAATVAEPARGAYVDWSEQTGRDPSAEEFMDAASRGRRYRSAPTPTMSGLALAGSVHAPAYARALADVALAASGTVTMEAALLGTPMVTFYRVSGLSWLIGRWLVRAPFLSMVNLVAGRAVVPELIQHDMRPDRLAAETLRLLDDPPARQAMRGELQRVREMLSSAEPPMDRAVQVVETVLNKETVNGR